MPYDEPRFKAFLIILLIIGIIASLYLPARVYEMTIKIYSGTASPYNIDYIGTSRFYGFLKQNNYTVTVANEWNNLVNSADSNTTIFIIAPDKPLSMEESYQLYDLAVKKKVDIVIADENITSNNFLRLLGINITGHAILYGIQGYESPYPPAIYFDIDNNLLFKESRLDNKLIFTYPLDYGKPTYVLRLNWASNIKIILSKTSAHLDLSIINNYKVFFLGAGYVDYNDNSKIDEVFNVAHATILSYESNDLLVNDEYIVYGSSMPYVIVGLIVDTIGGDIIILSDSFIFTNQALLLKDINDTCINIIKNILSHTNSGKIIIDNTHYYSSITKIGIPFHPAMIIYFLAEGLHRFDAILTDLVLNNQLIAFIISTGIILIMAIILQYALGFKALKSISPTSIDEVAFLAETRIRRGLLRKEKGIIKPRETIIDLWQLLNYVFYKAIGSSLEEIYRDHELLEKTSRILDIEVEEFRSLLKWLYGIYLKAVGRRKLPIILSWGRTLSKYINRVEHILELMGYSITRRAGYRGIEEILH